MVIGMTNITSVHPDPTAAFELTDPRPALAECGVVAQSVLAQIGPADLDRRTPADMTVGELLPHIVMAMRRAAATGRNDPFESWPDGSEAVSQPVAGALADALAEADEVWADDATLQIAHPLPWAPDSLGDESLAIFVNELLAHTWDLAVAIGAQPSWSDDTVRVALAAVRRQLPMADRTPIWEAFAAQTGADPADVVAFANAVDVPDDAPLVDQLLAWGGRDPSLAAG